MKECQLCKKGSRMVGNRILLRGHYNPTNWTRKYPNVQKAMTPEGEKVKACTQCIKTFTKDARMALKKEERAKKLAEKAVAIEAKKVAEKLKQEKKAARKKDIGTKKKKS